SSNDLVFPPYDADEWVNAQAYIDEPWRQLVQLWTHYNLHIVHVVSQISEEVLRKVRRDHNLHQTAFQTVPKDQPVALEYFIRDYVAHLKHHLNQIPSLERRFA